jgi:hypothetical protein
MSLVLVFQIKVEMSCFIPYFFARTSYFAALIFNLTNALIIGLLNIYLVLIPFQVCETYDFLCTFFVSFKLVLTVCVYKISNYEARSIRLSKKFDTSQKP